ncbi:uncharacterized protein LOC123671232 [Harmonia axyridis]|uniref:uncharacterized protein LOC123671232 n=1 Tax=Harmonia axyridis TaxID=115357 RepID=UPI001E275AFA|nr:uncharacterized protein LOC123671232 [Harmonia axyridis]
MRRDGRARWTEDDNVLLMRAHFIAKDLEQTSERTYRQILTEVWNDIRPDKPLYTNLLANRVRWMIENEKFSVVELRNIQLNIRPQGNEPIDEGEEHHEELRQSDDEDNGLTYKVDRYFCKNLLLYTGLSPENRPSIPRMKGSRMMVEKMLMVNKIIGKHISSNSSLGDLVDLVYAGALTVCEQLGKSVIKRCTNSTGQQPPWKCRIEKKIGNIRKKIGVLHTYLNSESPSSKVHKTVRRIASEFRIKPQTSVFTGQLESLCDNLKQRVKALGNRLRRYNERIKRYQNNQMYYKNQKQFFRNLESPEKTEEDPPEPEKFYEYWETIWGREKQHDDGAHWIREAEDESSKYVMDNITITKQDVEEVLKRTNNWAAPGPDGVHNYWWKHFTNTHGAMAALFQKAMRTHR